MPHKVVDNEEMTDVNAGANPKGMLSAQSDAVHDLLGIGFGPASLAIAVALYDVLEQRASLGSTSFMPKVKFLERQSTFGWHAGMLLPGTKMQISFLKDLASMRNPRSHFTFLNYLKEHNRLVQFANLNTFLPLRIEFEDYLKWSASYFSDIVQYSQNVIGIRPVRINGSEKFNCLEITSQDITTGYVTTQRAKSVVIAVGGQPSIPQVFPRQHERIIHSSKYSHDISKVLPNKDKAYSIAVVGAGQSAAEVFNDVRTRYPNCRSCLIMRDSAMRPSDDSPFVNEIFNPEVVDSFYSSPADSRRAQLRSNKATNYSVVRINLLEEIYESMYHQRIHNPNPDEWQHRILPSREIMEVVDVPASKRLNLVLKNSNGHTAKSKEVVTVDAIILATGYIRDSHNELLKECQAINGSSDGTWTTHRSYQVHLDRNFVDKDVQVYLQGCNEQTHGLSDTLLSILATRGGEIVDSVFGGAILEADTRDLVQRHGVDKGLNGPVGPLWKMHKSSGQVSPVSAKRKRTESVISSGPAKV